MPNVKTTFSFINKNMQARPVVLLRALSLMLCGAACPTDLKDEPQVILLGVVGSGEGEDGAERLPSANDQLGVLSFRDVILESVVGACVLFDLKVDVFNSQHVFVEGWVRLCRKQDRCLRVGGCV